MPKSQLPERVSLEYLKKLAKERLQELRLADPKTKLATALLAVARDHGFKSWRALKVEVEESRAKTAIQFFEACSKDDVELLRELLAIEPGLIRMSDTSAQHDGWTGLHSAARRGHLRVVQLLLDRGADPNTREAGDNTSPLHWAAAEGHVETVRALLNAGADPYGKGDMHELEAIGWATFHPQDRAPTGTSEIVKLLLERRAQHHIFSVIAQGDLHLIQQVVELNPEILGRRLSRFDGGLTALHYAISRSRYDILDLLIELGADLEAVDKNGHTPLASAMLSGDEVAVSRLRSAGAIQPPSEKKSDFKTNMAALEDSVRHTTPMISVADVPQTLAWYKSIGFREIARNDDGGAVNWALLSFGKADLMLSMGGKAGPHDVSLWFYTDQVDKLYQLLKSRSLELVQAVADQPTAPRGIRFVEHLYEPFYGGREFGIRDLNGYDLYFRQS